MSDSTNPAGLRLVPRIEPDTPVLPSRRLADGSIMFVLVEGKPGPYLVLVSVDHDEDLQSSGSPDGKR